MRIPLFNGWLRRPVQQPAQSTAPAATVAVYEPRHRAGGVGLDDITALMVRDHRMSDRLISAVSFLAGGAIAAALFTAGVLATPYRRFIR